MRNLLVRLHFSAEELLLPYNQKFSRESNFRYFREQFENVKKCLRENCTLKES